MEFCGGLVLLAFGFLLFAVFGHVAWLVLSAVFRGFSELGQPSRQPSPWRTCVKCDARFDRRAAECPSCGLDPHGKVATELRELEVTTRQVYALVDKHGLEQAA